jgi:hypothetical protein
MLADKILGDDRYFKLHPLLRKAIRINCDNVAEYYFEVSNKEIWKPNDFINVAPPWENMWFEYRLKHTITQIFLGLTKSLSIGVYVDILTDGLNYEYICRFINDVSDKGLVQVPFILHFSVDKNGSILTYKDTNKTWGLEAYKTAPNQDMLDSAVWMIKVPLLSLCFCHCKNITLLENKPPNKLNIKRIKKNKKPLLKYWTLDIGPIKEFLKNDGQIAKTGLKKALHICRGHFVTYTQEAPLFGRVVGTFWKPMHLRGNKKEGVVIKDYKIVAPE